MSEVRVTGESANPSWAPTLEEYRWRNVESLAQFLYVGLVEVTFLVQHFGYDALRAEDGRQVLLA